jgi:hypothetical protein
VLPQTMLYSLGESPVETIVLVRVIVSTGYVYADDISIVIVLSKEVKSLDVIEKLCC